jgi:hypothetical protein
MIGGVIKITRIYIEVREYSISSRQLTDADECSPPSGLSGFPLPGTIVEIFSNIFLRTPNDISIISTMNRPSALPFTIPIDIPAMGCFVALQGLHKWPVSRCTQAHYYSPQAFELSVLVVG